MSATFSDLEKVYERLAAAIDQAGPDKSEVFLAKLVLMLAERSGETAQTLQAIETCLNDL
jgi:hypothetical protein